MKGLVVDASVLVKVVVPETDSDEADELVRLRRSQLLRVVVPELILTECGNVLWKYCRRNLMTAEEASEAMSRLLAVPLTLVSHRDLVGPALDLATSHGRTVYDCTYLALADREGLPLLTADERLFNALDAEGFRMHLLSDWEPESLLQDHPF